MRSWIVALGVGVGVMVAQPVAANEWSGSYAWQFQSAGQRATAAAIADMIERRRHGGYGPATLTNNNFFGQYVGGDAISCGITATATGNAGTTALTGTSSSPNLVNQPAVSASTVGNAGGGLQSGGTSTSQQGNSGSQLSSGVSNTSTALTSGTINAGGGTVSQVLNQTQTNTSSPQTASVTNSQACRFVGR